MSGPVNAVHDDSYSPILSSRDGAVHRLRLNRPRKKNAIDRAMYRQMGEALRQAEADPAVRVHLVCGAGGVFTSGNDLADFASVAEEGGEADLLRDVTAFMDAVVEARKPIVAAVDGLAIGIGTTLLFHCDLVLATPQARFATPFLDLGLVPEFGSSLLGPALLGHQHAFALLALGEAFDSETAHRLGLVWRIAATDALEDEALAVAGRLAAKPPEALAATKRLLRKVGEEQLRRTIAEENALFAERLRSEEAGRAIAAFLSRKG